jgi:hypothetical protein
VGISRRAAGDALLAEELAWLEPGYELARTIN